MTTMEIRSPFSVAGKHVLVTGASSGLGRQAAIACAADGATVLISGRDKDRLEQTHAQLSGSGHETILGDLADDAIVSAVANSARKFDGVVHCVGVSVPMPMRMVTKEFLLRLFGTNVFIPLLLTQRLLAKGRVNKNGSILFLSSSAACRGVHGMATYSGTKSALIAATRCIALETARHGIRVNCLAPDLVETPMLDGSGALMPTTEWLDAQRKIHPLGLGTPSDVANAAIYFLSDASRWVTGTTLIMDGGITY